MIYTPDWGSLAHALERVVSTHGDLEKSKTAICDAIGDRKITVRVTVDRRPHRNSGRTFADGNIDIPNRICPADLDWIQSRPLRPWRIGPQPGEHYTWIGGWKPEPIELLELRNVDVTTVLRCEKSKDHTDSGNAMATDEFISYDEAFEVLCKKAGVMGFGVQVQAGTMHSCGYNPFADMQQTDEDRQQHKRIHKWLKEMGFTGQKFPAAEFERLTEMFPDTPSRRAEPPAVAAAPRAHLLIYQCLHVPWTPPRELTESVLLNYQEEPRIRLSAVVNLMAFGRPDVHRC